MALDVGALAEQIKVELRRAQMRRESSFQHIADAIAVTIATSPTPAMRAIASGEHQPGHFLEVRADDVWVVQHSLACRLSGRFYTSCAVHDALAARRESGEWPKEGRYQVSALTGGELTLRKVA